VNSDALANGEKQSDKESSRNGEELPAEFSPLLAGAGRKQEILSSANSTRPGSPVIKTADEIANTRQMVETAQLLAQKGGGSMKIQLKPEGLGFVELNVGVNGGKVDIQMTTENNEVKRLLESGMSELKSGLLQHKLNLESVQVDTSNRTQTGLETMLGQDRDTAREFLEQFRDFNQNRRQAGFDFMNTSGYSASAAKDRKLTPTDTRYANAKKSAKRLDLVA
jgi:flagellar hook-length control protein FliK